MPTNPNPDAWARRVDALLAKAASTEFPEEAEALLAKAQALMTRHAIDEAMLRQAGASRQDAVVMQATVVGRPYANARCSLLGVVARNNHCRLVLGRTTEAGRECILIGHTSDLRHVIAMHAALSLHGTRAMLAVAVPQRARSYRHAFLLAFAARIGERLRLARESERVDAEHRTGTGVGLALIQRWGEVDRVVRSEFPRLRPSRTTASSGAGIAGGRAAADAAPLGRAPLRSVQQLERGR